MLKYAENFLPNPYKSFLNTTVVAPKKNLGPEQMASAKKESEKMDKAMCKTS